MRERSCYKLTLFLIRGVFVGATAMLWRCCGVDQLQRQSTTHLHAQQGFRFV